MKIKAFAFDMDGTILTSSEAGAHPETIKALREAHKQGFKLILATGRPFIQTMPLAKEIGCISYLVSNNGSNVYDVQNDKFLNSNSIDFDIFERVLEVAEESKSFFALHTKKNVYRHYYFDLENSPSWLETSAHETATPISIEEIKRNAKAENITQVSLKNSKEIIAKYNDILGKEFEGNVSTHIANEVYLDVNPMNISKLTGLELVTQFEDFTLENIVSFGDSGNDIQMIKGSGYGIAMGNSTQELKDNANEVIGHHTTDTIGKKIRELIS